MSYAVPVERDGAFDVAPLTEKCREILEKGEHALLGVSHGNSYFNRERLTALMRWAAHRFAAVDVVIADSHVVHVLRALGYSEEHARRKAHKETRLIRNRVADAAGSLPEDRRPTVRGLSSFQDDTAYRAVLADVAAAMRGEPAFAAVVRAMTRAVVAARTGAADVREDQVEAALCYLEAELPFFFDTPRILGVGSSVSCYHLHMPVVDLLYGTDALVSVAPTQGFAVVAPAAGRAAPVPGPPDQGAAR
ncbi:tRNA-dependent cyclodipeptide synthase [Nocardiopsis trehalosi]|uniref:tRNA-dependent cyclodipeptide synthase n=1 Tax=Nocardiopsis trehalosi TaxID=109329 RepID=UPI000A9E8714|nr:tRNA-dependent cyclodipeptide synthase [Nocardiopsis trehalosi]